MNRKEINLQFWVMFAGYLCKLHQPNKAEIVVYHHQPDAQKPQYPSPPTFSQRYAAESLPSNLVSQLNLTGILLGDPGTLLAYADIYSQQPPSQAEEKGLAILP